MTEKTTAKLFAAAGNAGASKELLTDIAREMFHDFQSPLDTPKLALVGRLMGEGLVELAERVRQGEFDD